MALLSKEDKTAAMVERSVMPIPESQKVAHYQAGNKDSPFGMKQIDPYKR